MNEQETSVIGGTCNECGIWDVLYHERGVCRDCLVREGLPLPCSACGHLPIFGEVNAETGVTPYGMVECAHCGRQVKALNAARAVARWNALPDEERGAREATLRIVAELNRAIEGARRGSPAGNYPPHKVGLQRAIAIIEAMGGDEPRNAQDAKRADERREGRE